VEGVVVVAVEEEALWRMPATPISVSTQVVEVIEMHNLYKLGVRQ